MLARSQLFLVSQAVFGLRWEACSAKIEANGELLIQLLESHSLCPAVHYPGKTGQNLSAYGPAGRK
jgi:hypothetical protein